MRRDADLLRRFASIPLAAVGATVALVCATMVSAQVESEPEEAANSGIEEIVVRAGESAGSADFAEGDSVTGFGAEDLEAIGAQDIADLAAFTPNLEIVTAGSTTPTFFIRGVGLNDFNSNSTGAVAIYQDDVVRNAPALQLSKLFDIEAVNVVRGPQGTGLFRNASAGAIKVYARKPSGDFGGYLRADFGNFASREFEGALEAPIYKDILVGRIAFSITKRDGTMLNRCGNAPALSDRVSNVNATALGLTATDAPWSICGEPVPSIPGVVSDIPVGLATRLNNRQNWAARATFVFRPTLDMDWTFNFHGSRRDELSRVGQSIGTRGFFCVDGDVFNCGIPGNRGDLSARVNGVFGGTQGIVSAGYRAPEIQARLEELSPCQVGQPGLPFGTCLLTANLAPNNIAKIKLAKELARDLDSEPWKGDFNRTGDTKNDIWGTYLKGDIVLPLGVQLTTISGFDTYDRKIDLDLDFSPETLFQIVTDDEGWQFTQDIRLEGVYGDEGQFRWDIGGYFLRESLDVLVSNDLGILSAFGVGSREYTQDLWSAAGYASIAFDFWQDFTIDGGFRYNTEKKILDYSLIQGVTDPPIFEKLRDTWSAPTGTIRLTYRFREDTHVFWKYTRGWKPGTYNATSSRFTGVSTADPEKIDAFETGMNGSWFDGRIGLEGSFFFYKYRDYQLFTAQQFAGGQPEFVILNAEEAEVYGAEMNLTGRPWQGAFVNVNASWLESQFLDFVQLQQATVVRGGTQVTINRELQNTGNPLLNSPRFKVSLTLEQVLELGRWGSVTARWDGVWTDTTYYDATRGRGIPNPQGIAFLPEDTIAQKPFWLHNLRLTYQPLGGQVEIAGWVRNVTNEVYKTFAFDASTFSQTSIFFVGDPRTYGGSINIRF